MVGKAKARKERGRMFTGHDSRYIINCQLVFNRYSVRTRCAGVGKITTGSVPSVPGFQAEFFSVEEQPKTHPPNTRAGHPEPSSRLTSVPPASVGVRLKLTLNPHPL